MNERTHSFIKIYLSHFILERVMFLVCERWAGDGDRLLIWPKVLLLTIAALLPHLGLVAQPWVTESPDPSVCRWLSIRHLVSNWLQLQLTQAVCVLVIFLFDVHLILLFFRLFTQVHLLIDGSAEGQYVTLTVQAIASVPADIKAIIYDSNRVNQAFLKLYPTLSEKFWLTEDNKHLLFDYVHLLKNIRNLWLTERIGELIFDDDGVRRVAKWAHLKQLYGFESERLVKLSDLKEISIAPKPIERQQVSICLRVFSEKTYNALLTQFGISVDKNDTSLFINKVLTWWKILNFKSLQIDKLSNDHLRAEIKSTNDTRLDFIIEFGKVALNKADSQGNRKKNIYPKTLLLPYIIFAMK